MKNTTYIEKCLEFNAVTYILTFTKMVHLRKNGILLKKKGGGGYFIGPKNQRFRPKSTKMMRFSNVGTSVA